MLRLVINDLPADVIAADLRDFLNSLAPLKNFNLQRDRQGNRTFAILAFANDKDGWSILKNPHLSWQGRNVTLAKWDRPIKPNKPLMQGGYGYQDQGPPMNFGPSPRRNRNFQQGNSGWIDGNNEPFSRKRTYDNSFMGGGGRQNNNFNDSSHDMILRNLDDQRRTINDRIMYLENSMRMSDNTLRNMNSIGRKVPRFHEDVSFNRPSFSSRPINNGHGKPMGFGMKPKKPVFVPSHATAFKPKLKPKFQTSKYRFDSAVVRQLVSCYVELYQVKALDAIKTLGEKGILRGDMVRYASGNKLTVQKQPKVEGQVEGAEQKISVVEVIKVPLDIPTGPLFSSPEMSKTQKIRVLKSIQLIKKKCMKVFRSHKEDPRFLEALKKEAPQELQEEMMKEPEPTEAAEATEPAQPEVQVDPAQFENLPKCPPTPENYFNIREYYEQMCTFYNAFARDDYLAYNFIKRAYTAAPPVPNFLRRSIIYCVQVNGVYDLKDKKYVVKLLSKYPPLLILRTEPTLVLGCFTKQQQQQVLKHNGERFHHIKLYLKAFSPAAYEKADAAKKLFIERSLGQNKKRQLRALFHDIGNVFAAHIADGQLPQCAGACACFKDVEDVDESAMFADEKNEEEEALADKDNGEEGEESAKTEPKIEGNGVHEATDAAATAQDPVAEAVPVA